MELCERCGVELPAGAPFCRKCGRRTTSSWAVPRAPAEAAEPAARAGNAFSTLAVFFGVVATISVILGGVAVALATVAFVRKEPSRGFAVVVAAVGTVIGIVVRTVLLDSA